MYRIARYIVSGSDQQISEDFTGYPRAREDLPKRIQEERDIVESPKSFTKISLEDI